jgi:hypothetical protein
LFVIHKIPFWLSNWSAQQPEGQKYNYGNTVYELVTNARIENKKTARDWAVCGLEDYYSLLFS